MPRKLGQHFLINREKIKKIIASISVEPNDIIIEIGPGHGELTTPLLTVCKTAGCKEIIAIERDTALAQKLSLLNPLLKIIEGDALALLPKIISQNIGKQNYIVVGNIPYSITGKLFRTMGGQTHKPRQCVFTIQKEVADRICARPPKMNLLAASIQIWADTSILGMVPRRDFNPPPAVDSAVLLLVTKTDRGRLPSYYAMIKILFKQPRKTVFNNLRAGLPPNFKKKDIEGGLSRLGLRPDLRPQNLDIHTILALSKKFLPIQ